MVSNTEAVSSYRKRLRSVGLNRVEAHVSDECKAYLDSLAKLQGVSLGVVVSYVLEEAIATQRASVAPTVVRVESEVNNSAVRGFVPGGAISQVGLATASVVKEDAVGLNTSSLSAFLEKRRGLLKSKGD